MIWVNQIIQGVLLGGYYALVACGLSFMFSVMGIINIAHGSFAILAAFALFVLAAPFGISPFYGLILAVPAMAALGWAVPRLGFEAGQPAGSRAAIGMATVGLAGAALAMRATFDPYAGAPQLIFAFEAAVIGGAGSLWGTLIGGIVLGVAQNVGAQISPQGFFIAGHGIFLVILFGRLYWGGGVAALFGHLRRRA